MLLSHKNVNVYDQIMNFLYAFNEFLVINDEFLGSIVTVLIFQMINLYYYIMYFLKVCT